MKRVALFSFLAVGLVAVLPFLGDASIGWADLWSKESVGYRIFWELRVPRLILTLSAGGALAVLGVAYQIIFHNPLAEPYIMGVSSAVILGCVTAETVLVGAGLWFLGPVAWGAMLGLLAVLLIVTLASSRFGSGLDRLVLFGMGMNFVLSSLVFLALSYQSQQVGGGAMRWLFGHIPWSSVSDSLILAAVSLATLGFLYVFSRQLDALSLGDAVARTLGISASRWRSIILGLSSVSLAIVVASTGTIGFVGLVVPHAVTLAFRPTDTRWLLLLSFLVGAVFLAICDVLARTLYPPFEFPIGVLTTLVGGPLFLFLLWKRGR